MEPEAAMNKLLEGNKRFMNGNMEHKDIADKRAQTKDGQSPIATVVCCSDSRVVPELIFDTNLGELFKVANAGNLAGDLDIGSVEYGVGHLHTPLLIVMGHEKCGAVTAAYDGGHAESKIAKIVKKITPSVKKAKKGGERSAEIEKAVVNNVKSVIRKLKKSPVVSKAMEEGKVKVVGMKYFFTDGRVELV